MKCVTVGTSRPDQAMEPKLLVKVVKSALMQVRI